MTEITSGGAVGADETWDNEFIRHGVVDKSRVLHYSFPTHTRRSDSLKGHIFELTDNDLSRYDHEMKVAAEALGRRLPPVTTNTGRLLRRNFFQTGLAARFCLGVGTFSDIEEGRISGGTAWAFKIFELYKIKNDTGTLAFFYDQNVKCWFGMMGGSPKWIKMGETYIPPVIQGEVTAAIGTRDLNDYGWKAIYNVARQAKADEQKDLEKI